MILLNEHGLELGVGADKTERELKMRDIRRAALTTILIVSFAAIAWAQAAAVPASSSTPEAQPGLCVANC